MTAVKIAIVTGGASGIGLATAIRFAEAGTVVYVLDIQVMPKGLHANIHGVECDVRRYDVVSRAVESVFAKHGRIDVLFANAGIHFYGTLEETTEVDFDHMLSVNVKGVFHALKSVLPIMKSQRSGAVVLMGSDQSLVGKVNSFAYGAAKGAIAQMTKSLAIDCGPYNIRVNCVCPGAIETPLYRRALGSYSEKYTDLSVPQLEKSIADKYLLKRIGQPKEVANVVTFLCSEEASFITGAILPIDGGLTAQ